MAAEAFVNIGDLLAHDVPLEWYESVAVVQEVCARLFGAKAAGPDPSRIRLYQSGRIELLEEAVSGEAPVQRLGYVLTALLQGTSPPAELRLLASQMVASGPGASLDDFSRRLSYFERPGRSTILQVLYERVVPVLAAALNRADARNAAAARDAGTASGLDNAQQTRSTWTGAHAWIAAVAVLTGCGVVVWAWRFTGTNSSPVAARGMYEKARTAAGSLVAGGVSSARALLSQAGLVPEPNRAAVPPPAPEPHKPVRLRRARIKKDANPLLSSEPLLAPTSEPVQAIAPLEVVTPPAPEPVAPPPLDLAIYTTSAPEVVPPILVSPQLPAVSRQARGIPSVSGGEVDLLVDVFGYVESVKVVSLPQQFNQRMLLSAMKAWRYQPALKDGRPVRYVVRVAIPF